MFKRKREGVLIVDHTFSPGISEAEAAKMRSYGHANILAVPEGTQLEIGTLTCAHCGTVVIKNPKRIRERGRCSKCDHFICDPCEALGDCRPIQALADAVVGSDKHLSPTSPLLIRSK